MNRCLGLIVIGTLFTAAQIVMAQERSDHHEVGGLADYFRLSGTTPVRNFVGVGGRAAFNVHRDVQLEAEMAYDFKRNFTQDFSDGVTTQLVNTQFRTLHGFFGPKFQTGSGAFRFFVTGKVGFDNFTVNNQNAPAGFKSTVGLDNGKTDFALYPAAGIEAFAGPIGIRLEAGDDIYFDHGSHNNLRVNLGTQIRF